MNELKIDELRSWVEYWIRYLGLSDWAISVTEESLPARDETVVSRAFMNWTQRAAKITLNSAYRQSSENTGPMDSVERVALHEVLHILLCDLVNTCADQRDAYCNVADSAEHAVIRRLMTVLKAPK